MTIIRLSCVALTCARRMAQSTNEAQTGTNQSESESAMKRALFTVATAVSCATAAFVVGTPVADAAPAAVFSASKGAIVAKATGLPTVNKTCTLYRSYNFFSEPLSTLSASSPLMEVKRVTTTAPVVVLVSPPLAHASYEVQISCATATQYPMDLFSKTGRVVV